MRVWQPHYSGPLTPEDAVEILVNVGQLFGAMGLTSSSQGVVRETVSSLSQGQ